MCCLSFGASTGTNKQNISIKQSAYQNVYFILHPYFIQNKYVLIQSTHAPPPSPRVPTPPPPGVRPTVWGSLIYIDNSSTLLHSNCFIFSFSILFRFSVCSTFRNISFSPPLYRMPLLSAFRQILPGWLEHLQTKPRLEDSYHRETNSSFNWAVIRKHF
jgi:hypothetical protein